jgi:3-hydroxyisobutyrate dehydrogenase-like beta-hydroxyacid dehydrogenase
MTDTIKTAARRGQENGAAIEGSERTAVTVIGLGLMGRALAEPFLQDGRPTTVWNRSPGKADDLVARGAVRAATAAEAVAASPLVVMCVRDNDAVRAILEPVGDALDGRVLVNLTSGTPEQARELAGWAAERGADYLDGVIMAIPPMIGQAETTLFYSGEPTIFETYQSTLKLLGGATTYVGPDPGLAALYDMALLSMMYALYGGALHALALVGTAQIDGATLMPYATRLMTDVVSWLPDLAREVDAGDYATEVSTLDINQAGVALIIQTSEELGVRADVLRPIQALIDRRVAEGHGRDGLASLIEAVRQPSA